MSRPWLAAGALFGALGVALGAFGAHLLRDTLSPQAMTIYETAIHYLQIHALALLGTGLLMERRPDRRAYHWAAWTFAGGCILFSGSLIALAITGLKWLGAITPVGGTLWLIAWVSIAAGSLSRD